MTEKKIKKKIKKCRMVIRHQTKDFDNQHEARQAAIRLLQTGLVYFVSLKQVEVLEE